VARHRIGWIGETAEAEEEIIRLAEREKMSRKRSKKVVNKVFDAVIGSFADDGGFVGPTETMSTCDGSGITTMPSGWNVKEPDCCGNCRIWHGTGEQGNCRLFPAPQMTSAKHWCSHHQRGTIES